MVRVGCISIPIFIWSALNFHRIVSSIEQWCIRNSSTLKTVDARSICLKKRLQEEEENKNWQGRKMTKKSERIVFKRSMLKPKLARWFTPELNMYDTKSYPSQQRRKKTYRYIQLVLNLFTILFVHKMWWSIKRFQCNWKERVSRCTVVHIKLSIFSWDPCDFWCCLSIFSHSLIFLYALVSPFRREIFFSYNFCNRFHGNGTFIHSILKMERKHVSRIAFLVYFTSYLMFVP